MYGPRSAAALRRYQAKNSLTVTGGLDAKTRRALNIGYSNEMVRILKKTHVKGPVVLMRECLYEEGKAI
jgi:hypothetical protein